MYSDRELTVIRDTLARKQPIAASEVLGIREAVSALKPNVGMMRLVALSLRDPELYAKLVADERVATYAHTAFFPETYPLVYGSETSPVVEVYGGNRGTTVALRHPTKSVIVKPAQSPREAGIAQIASDLGVGPQQYASIDGYISEEYVDGALLSAAQRQLSPYAMNAVGKRVGEIFAALHEKDIFYNDTNISDDMGRSHIIVSRDGPAKLFDFGVALNLSGFPYMDDHAVLDFARTLPVVNMFWQMDPSEEHARKIIAQYRPILSQITKPQILHRDLDFLAEGLSVLSNAPSFAAGFKETYSVK